jgi:hypothetical protein
MNASQQDFRASNGAENVSFDARKEGTPTVETSARPSPDTRNEKTPGGITGGLLYLALLDEVVGGWGGLGACAE